MSATKHQTKAKYRHLMIAGVSLGLIVISVSSASAQLGLGTVGNILNKAQKASPILKKTGLDIQPELSLANGYLQDANDYWNQISSFYYNISAGNLEGMLGDISGITGALGIPDPFAVRTQGEWNEQIPGTMTTAQSKGNTADRAIALGVASTVLGQEGQTLIRSQQQQVAETVQQSALAAEQSGAAAQQAQSRNVTQDILKDVAVQQGIMAQQQAMLTQVNQQMSGQLTSLQLQGAASNLLMANISGTLDQQEVERQQQRQDNNLTEAQTAAQIFIPGINLSE